ncbi:unnamed protein product [Diatraea saccharalis]|uniref:Uncharacterized protein n=1 Tax=Diatraea saccharalis TaxID=40085 RepID=A0A9N9WCQ7_9NEOP|nr:unnamed protein product [Diatraea saccharalis]
MDKIINIEKEECSPKKELYDSIPDISLNDESMSEIDGTPGRTSPIIHSKKLRNGFTNQSSDQRDKKKCPENWPTPENKALKLIFTTPSKAKSKGKGKLRQSRLNVVDLTMDKFVDLTSSPELMCRDSQCDSKVSTEYGVLSC